MKKSFKVFTLILLLSIFVSACANTASKSTAKEENTTSKKVTNKKKLSKKEQKEILDIFYKMETTIAYYDSQIGNIGYMVQDGIDQQVVESVQSSTQENLTSKKDKIANNATEYKNELRATKANKKDVENVISEYDQLFTYYNGWIQDLESLNLSNVSTVSSSLSDGQDDYLAVSNDLSEDMMDTLVKTGMSKSDASLQFKKIIKKSVKNYGDPVDAENMKYY
ncbi:hypothetical protein [Companilactobacillus metriopterae]|uniref:hypothetical protein n=1 Tax=Companilactobacillus metriopterae TaxID=1909267 RepID=UPI00100BD2C0|nr:hypothetical protein [Companilactobacillus metriopterae]